MRVCESVTGHIKRDDACWTDDLVLQMSLEPAADYLSIKLLGPQRTGWRRGTEGGLCCCHLQAGMITTPFYPEPEAVQLRSNPNPTLTLT